MAAVCCSLGDSWKVWVLRLSWQWCIKLLSSGLWRHVVLWYDTNVSEVHAASIFTLKMESSLDLSNVGIIPQHCILSQHTIPQLDSWKVCSHDKMIWHVSNSNLKLSVRACVNCIPNIAKALCIAYILITK